MNPKLIVASLLISIFQSCHTQTSQINNLEKIETVDLQNDNRKEKSPNAKPPLQDSSPNDYNDPMKKGKDALKNNPEPKK